jgi:tRNA(Arg) A34 adenosine deaminase TadA
MQYNDLTNEWKHCFKLARKAFYGGALPISCLVLDSNNKILSDSFAKMVYGGNKSNITQHAEMIALSKIPLSEIDKDNNLTLYTTVEPCPMCFGAINVARIKNLCYATRDPWAGSVNLINGNWYLKRKQINLFHENDDFEKIMTCWVVYAMTRCMDDNQFFDSFKNEFATKWGEIIPGIIQLVGKIRKLHLDLLLKIDDEKFFTILNDTIFENDYERKDEASSLNIYEYAKNMNSPIR